VLSHQGWFSSHVVELLALETLVLVKLPEVEAEDAELALDCELDCELTLE
jgi:hypothetical protein